MCARVTLPRRMKKSPNFVNYFRLTCCFVEKKRNTAVSRGLADREFSERDSAVPCETRFRGADKEKREKAEERTDERERERDREKRGVEKRTEPPPSLFDATQLFISEQRDR